MRIAFSADHAGAPLKAELLRRLAGEVAGEHELIDLGGDGSDPDDDYPDFARALGEAIQQRRADRGILICGSGVGASIAACKMRGVRAAVCHDTYSAHQGVEHDDMNVLTLGARVIGPEPALECARAFLAARFSGEQRHVRRLAKVQAIEDAAMGDRT
jgi:ribose 5-phosphate isomerase B